MKVMDNIKGALRVWLGVESKPVRRRAFAAASTGRTVADWTSSETTIDNEVRTSGRTVRTRARSLSHENDYARRFVSLVRSNVVGPNGFKLQVLAQEYRNVNGELQIVPDRFASAVIENAWYEWGKAVNCTVSGRQTFREVCDMAVRYAARDGEVFIRLVRDKKVPFGIRLQFIDPMNVDEQYTTRLKGGNVVKMGVEMDVYRRPVAYYVKKSDPQAEMYGYTSQTTDYMRVPAEDMIHLFDQEYEGQTRGISWMLQSMWRLKMLQGYEEATVVKARVAASDMAYLIPGVDSPDQGSMQGNTVDSDGNVIADAEPGGMRTLPAGWDVKTWGHDWPGAQHGGFVKGTLRGISSGLGVAFNTFANDLEGVNYSSIRAGVIDEREMWKALQSWFAEKMLDRVYSAWLEMAILTDYINLPISKFDKYNSPRWTGRRWPWVDPKNDVEAQLLALDNGLTTRARILAEQGEDLEETLSALRDEKALEEQYGLNLGKVAAPPAAPSANGQEEGGGADDAEDAAEDAGKQEMQKLADEARKTAGEVYAAIADIRDTINGRITIHEQTNT